MKTIELVIPEDYMGLLKTAETISTHIPRAEILIQTGIINGQWRHRPYLDIRYRNGSSIIVLSGETLKIEDGRAHRVVKK